MLKTHPHKHVIYWLLSGCLLISMMVIIGGVTRLTNSGLSMTDWSLISEVIPPLNEAEWTDAFEEYKSFQNTKRLIKGWSCRSLKNLFLGIFSPLVWKGDWASIYYPLLVFLD